jgi:tRNA G18 (ribose-2'-O)-methylase SpoU
MERIGDASDPRVADYAGLRDPARRSRIEPEGGFFVAEGETVIRRLLASDHRVRSVFLSDDRFRRMREAVESIDAPVYVAERHVIAEVVGFDLHRGALASGERRPPAEIEGLPGSVAVLEGLNDHENL